MSKNGAILLGIVVALTGIVIIGVAFFGKAEGFHAPRWVVGCAGGSFLFFGGWLAALYATGYDPTRDKETLPSAGVQSLVLIPGMLCFAAPFHWIAFGPGPRQFSSSLSIPFLTTRHASSGLSGRVMFGIGALLIDAILVAAVVGFMRTGRARREGASRESAPAASPEGRR
ncbi:MAG: hypothetical protein ABI592_11490 [Acidobacteriota bacterium]